MSRTRPLQHVDIARNENYLAFPDVALALDGSLVCTYFKGDLHSPNWSRIVVRVSKDLGQMWSPPSVLATASMQDNGHCWNCPRISTLPDGRLVLLCDYEDQSEERAIWAWWSEDQGRSWSEPKQIMPRGLVPDRIVTLPSGRMLLVVPCSKAGLILFASHDSGASWTEMSEMRPGHRQRILLSPCPTARGVQRT